MAGMDVGGGHSVGSDRISSLPDDLLHTILVHLHSAPAAARSSVLSRRWHRVWVHLPELALEEPAEHSTVDAALAAFAAPTLRRLVIRAADGVKAAHVAPWLRFASERVAGELWLHLRRSNGWDRELTLPLCERVRTIKLEYRNVLRLPREGQFAALTVVTIVGARMEGRDMECFGSSQCPRLRKLVLCWVMSLSLVDRNVSIRSDSLEELFFTVNNVHRLEVVAPRLQCLQAPWLYWPRCQLAGCRIVAPKLTDVSWFGDYNPRHHQFVDAARCLRRLMIRQLKAAAALMKRFDTVDMLQLDITILPGIEEFDRFLKATSNLAKCDTLRVDLYGECHAYAPIVLHLIRKSPGVRKLVVRLTTIMTGRKDNFCPSGCPCRLPESYRTDNISLDSLEEVVIDYFRGEEQRVEFVEFLDLLLGCRAAALKSVAINLSPHVPSVVRIMEAREKTRRAGRLDNDVTFKVWSGGRLVVPYTRRVKKK